MSIGKASCLVCGEPLIYFEEAREVECVICHKKEWGHSFCERGHYVCDDCHRSKGVEYIMELCRSTESRNPIRIAMEAMNHRAIYPNGPEHHTLVGAVLLAAYRNAGGNIDLGRSLDELRGRSLNVPGGTCGFWGCCGAAISAGMYMSIVTGSTPMTVEPWAQTTRLTSRILSRLADIGGPRCCKRTSFAAIEMSVVYTSELLKIDMELPDRIICTFSSRNGECLGKHCPYSAEYSCADGIKRDGSILRPASMVYV